MRILGLIGLVLALVIAGVLVKKQLGGIAAVNGPAAGGEAQAQQIQQQVKQSLDAAMQQQRRAMPDDN